MPSNSTYLDDVFMLLSTATQLEESGTSRIEAATKYYEAVYLMRRYLERLPVCTCHRRRGGGGGNDNDRLRDLLESKCRHYEQVAAKLMADDTSSVGNNGSPFFVHPLSPMDHATASIAPAAPAAVADTGVVVSEMDLALRAVQAIASRANTKLSLALDLDERQGHSVLSKVATTAAVIAAYMEAAELYLEALHTCEQVLKNNNRGGGTGTSSGSINRLNVMRDKLKRRLEQTLDRVEQLKQPKQQQKSKPRTITAKDQDAAAGRGSSRTPPRGSHSASNGSKSPVPYGSNNINKSNKSHRSGTTGTLSEKEIAILKRSSLIASGLFLPWSEQDAADLSAQAASATAVARKQKEVQLYTDPAGFLALSAKQKERFYTWARPKQIVALRKQCGMLSRLRDNKNGQERDQRICMVRNITPYTMKQVAVTDCSFIASLCIAAALERRFGKPLVTNLLHPHNNSANNNNANGKKHATCMYNPAGKYMVQLWLNGVARAVVIDDYLPVDRYGNVLCSHTTETSGDALELYVCLIEKAYMKLAGGYDFPGSNSGVDLFSLTGWIPERILFAADEDDVRDFETPRERVWERIESATSFGDCLVTVSTHLDLTQEEADAIGLVTGHAYAVLAVIQTTAGVRLLQLKNPWAHKGWKGRYSRHDEQGWADASLRKEVGYNPKKQRDAHDDDDGVFWICWDDVVHYFQNFHLSWNPALFQYRTTVHGNWPANQGPADDTFNVGENPQYVMTLSDKAVAADTRATIWILISRHVTKQEQEGTEATDFLTVHVHRASRDKERVWYPGQSGNCILTGAYTNNPHVLVRYDVAGPEDKYLSLVLSQYKKSHDLAYTLSCFSTQQFTLSQPAPPLRHCLEFSSAWTAETAGGPIGRDTFHKNPTFALRCCPPGGEDGGDGKGDADGGNDEVTLQFFISTNKTVAVNVVLVPVRSYGQGIRGATGNPAFDMGKYRHGFLATERIRVAAASSATTAAANGHHHEHEHQQACYAVVVSNFHYKQEAPFLLKIYSNRPIQAEPIVSNNNSTI